jgi:ATP-dependent RNA helicase RhlE
MSFQNIGLLPALQIALSKLAYNEAYPIQEKVIPALLNKQDVLGIAKTGSGKTLSYVLPILQNLQLERPNNGRQIQALVLVPTRELAVQVESVFKDFAHSLPLAQKCMAVFGGVSINPQMKALFKTNVLVATPGRLLDLLDNNALDLKAVSVLVLDEADKMLNLGFQKEMEAVLKVLPAKRQNALFSATLSPAIQNLENLILKDAAIIKIEETVTNIDLIQQSAFLVPAEKKGPLLRFLIEKENMEQVLVFTSSVYQADAVAHKLQINGIDAKAIHSKKSQGARTEALQLFKNKKIRVLVATDLLSRGIDIAFLPFVINYELPRSPKDFIHRIGRTGRAENPGQAITFVTLNEDEHHFHIIQKKMKKKVDLQLVNEIGKEL